MSNIVFLSKQDEFKKTAKGGYNILTVNFRDENGKVASRKLFDFVAKDVYKAFSAGVVNEIFEITEVTNEKGYKEFASAKTTGKFDSAGAGVAQVPASGSAAPKSNYETADERANRQILIVRQSSLSTAVDYLKAVGNAKAKVSDVITIAKQLEGYVFGTSVNDKVESAVRAIQSQRDDIDDDISDIVL
jgi:hypothetical protein